jgi:putative nucleotidyltransferase with HDIG domain
MMRAVRANLYIGAMAAAGGAILCHAVLRWQSQDALRFIAFGVIALLSSTLKVTLPGVPGTLSTNFVFVLIGVSQLSLSETLAISTLAMITQCVFRAHRLRAVQTLFNVASVAVSVQLSYGVYHWALLDRVSLETAPRLLLASAAYFAANTLSVAVVISLTENKPLWATWRGSYFWSFPNYLLGAAVAWTVNAVVRWWGWQTSLLLLPVLYAVYRFHHLYVQKLEEEKTRAEQQRKHAEELAALHRRTIETLAIAIEAKDQTTADHLARVEVYSVEVAKELGLSENELEALRAAALLHDIGKLAVPEYIISKPGKLTPEEFEKMKTHTIVGGEIVERIQFPYPVAPIVRAHHEKWDGTGYPDGLAGDHIPLGARILTAVDCLDALASDRQYRRALPLSEAIKIVQAEAGKSFDPRVVDILARRYVELERLARGSGNAVKAKLSTGVKIERGQAPAAGFEAGSGQDLVNLHVSMQQSGASGPLADLRGALESSIGRDDAFALLRSRLRVLVDYEAMVVYLRREDRLIPELVDGDDYRLFASPEIPLGMGLSGWVAENRKPILNGNPSVEPGYLSDPTKFSMLRSALAVPIEDGAGIVGVLSLYRLAGDAFSRRDQELLMSLAASLGRRLEVATPPGAILTPQATD